MSSEIKTITNYLVTTTCQFMVGADDKADAEREAAKVMDAMLLDPRVKGGPSGVTYTVDTIETLDDDSDDPTDAAGSADSTINLEPSIKQEFAEPPAQVLDLGAASFKD